MASRASRNAAAGWTRSADMMLINHSLTTPKLPIRHDQGPAKHIGRCMVCCRVFYGGIVLLATTVLNQFLAYVGVLIHVLRCVEMLRHVGQESTDARLEVAGQELVGICRISWVLGLKILTHCCFCNVECRVFLSQHGR